MSENKTVNENTKENDALKRKREIIKTLLIIFLAAMLLLTFFSNTLMNRSLAEITTDNVTSGKLTERVRGSGLVESNQAYEVIIEGGKTIDKIHIRNGREVKKDDVMFTVSTGSREEIEAAENALSALELEYQKALLAENADYSAENQAIKNAREDLNSAIIKRDEAYRNQSGAEQAHAQYISDKNELTRLSGIQQKLSATISAMDNDDYSGAAQEYIGNLVTLLRDYSSADNEYKAAYEIYSQAVEAGGDAETAKADADAKAAARDSAKQIYDTEKSKVRNELTVELSLNETEICAVSLRIAEYEASAGNSGMSYEECAADVQAKQRILEDLIISLQKAQKADSISGQLSNLDLEAKKKEMDKLREKIQKLENESSATEIKSQYDGVVSAINVQPNEITAEGMPAAVIDISAEGYTVKVSVDASKAAKLRKGVKADIMNSRSSGTEAVLTDIRNDTTAGSQSKILVFSVTGDVDSGTMLDLSIPCGSGNYDAIVPKSAVYQDKDGYFVLTVRSKSSPLGNRYYAERINVEVLSSDEMSSAVGGDIGMGDYVITAASKPISAGDQVRIEKD